MVSHQVVDAAGSLHILTVAANILKKQSRTADNVWSSSLEVGLGSIIFNVKSHHPPRSVKAQGLRQNFRSDLRKGKEILEI